MNIFFIVNIKYKNLLISKHKHQKPISFSTKNLWTNTHTSSSTSSSEMQVSYSLSKAWANLVYYSSFYKASSSPIVKPLSGLSSDPNPSTSTKKKFNSKSGTLYYLIYFRPAKKSSNLSPAHTTEGQSEPFWFMT